MGKKRLITCLLMVALLAFTVAGCSSPAPSTPTASAPSTPAASAPATPAPPAEEDIAYPERPIEIITGTSAGGDTDINARLIAKYLTEELGQPVIVTNMPGAGTSVAMNEVLLSDADGYRFMFNHVSMYCAEAFGISEVGLLDFVPVCIVGLGTGECLIVRSDLPVNTVPELISYTKQHPGEIRYAYNPGGTSHFAGAMLLKAGAEFNMVSTGTASERVVGLVGRHLDVIASAPSAVADYLEEGTKEFKVLANTLSERHPSYPNYPTCLEQGVNLNYDPMYTIYGLPGTDQRIFEKVSKACEKIITTNKDYAEDIMKAYKQVPYYQNGSDSLVLLTKLRDSMMSISDELKATLK